MSAILKRQPRDVVLNLCQYGMGKVWEWGREVGGNSWRTAGDLGLRFEEIGTALFRDGFDVHADNDLHRHGGPGVWIDPDYLLLGYLSNWKGATAPTPLTPNEQYTHVSLWLLLAAPLIFSGDATRLDPFKSSGPPPFAVSREGELALCLRHQTDGFLQQGTLARLLPGGVAPREVQEDVVGADWSPEKELAVVRCRREQTVIEFPIGRTVHQTPGWISSPRFSPAGERLAGCPRRKCAREAPPAGGIPRPAPPFGRARRSPGPAPPWAPWARCRVSTGWPPRGRPRSARLPGHGAGVAGPPRLARQFLKVLGRGSSHRQGRAPASHREPHQGAVAPLRPCLAGRRIASVGTTRRSKSAWTPARS